MLFALTSGLACYLGEGTLSSGEAGLGRYRGGFYFFCLDAKEIKPLRQPALYRSERICDSSVRRSIVHNRPASGSP